MLKLSNNRERIQQFLLARRSSLTFNERKITRQCSTQTTGCDLFEQQGYRSSKSKRRMKRR